MGRFINLLTNTCTLTFPGVEVGRDKYNKPIFEDVPETDVQCRFDQKEEVVSRNEFGTQTVTKLTLFLLPTQHVDTKMIISNIRDKQGNLITDDTFAVANLGPQYNKVRLHHYEVTLRQSDDA